MYSNISKKIKISAIVLFIVETVVAIIMGIVLICVNYSDATIITFSVVIMIIVPGIALVFSWFLYGFGELIDIGDELIDIADEPIATTDEVTQNIDNGTSKTKVLRAKVKERISEIESLRSKGLITKEEYQQIMSKHNEEV
ncbi:MAG: hypothetical protein KBS41_04980 [Oscillospiraceae bacterium]|nr:hypothetical protein [Candidatus Equicaccousia limihippi]